MKYKAAKKRKQIVSAVLLLVFTLICSFNTIDVQAANISTGAVNGGPDDAKELEKFCDGFFNEYMEKDQVPGAVISVVKDGEILFEKGYGYADIENKILVDPKKTAFYICSTGKLFTGTAVMQLYEQGKIKGLEDDVNLYMDTIKVSNKFSTPVTFANLLTHTSGLDDGSVIGGASKSQAGVLSYEEYLKAKLGSVLREPDTLVRYSNLGYNLLGYLVQEISGLSFADYIKKNIFGPLGMENSTTGETPDNAAVPYIYDGEAMQPSKKVYLPALGEGCIFSTADDMAKFMMAHLQDGSYNGNRILKEDTAKLMQKQHFTNDPALPGICYTFLQSFDNNQKAIRHEGGDASGYISTLYLLPEYNLGFFVEVNTLSTLPITFEKEFLNHYFPYAAGTAQASVEYGKDYSELTGIYRSYDDISVSTILKIKALFSEDGEMQISEGEDGALYMYGTSFEGYPIATELIQKGNLLFKRADDANNVAFRRDKQGNVAYAFNNEPQKTFEKIRWYQSQEFNFLLLGICIVVFLINVIGRIITYVRRKIEKQPLPTRLEAAGTMMWIVGVINIASTAAFVMMLFTIGYEIQYGFPLMGYISLGGFLVGTVLSIGAAAFCILLWIKKRKSLIARIFYTISTIFCIAFSWFLNYWNILGFRLN